MLDTDYAFLSGYLKGEESKILDVSRLSGLAHNARIQDLLNAIDATDIGSFLDNVTIEAFSDIDRHLWAYLNDCSRDLELLRGIPADVVKLNRAYMFKYDIINIKSAIRRIYLRQNSEIIPIGLFSWYGFLDELEKASDISSIVEIMRNFGFQEYAWILRNMRPEASMREVRTVEREMENMYFFDIINLSDKVPEGELLKRVFGIIVDMINLSIAFRLSFGLNPRGFIPFLENGYMISMDMANELSSATIRELPGMLTGSPYKNIADEIISAYEADRNIMTIDRVVEKNKIRILSEMLSPRVMSPVVVIWYLVLKESELRNLRILSKAVFDGIPASEVKEYLVTAS